MYRSYLTYEFAILFKTNDRVANSLISCDKLMRRLLCTCKRLLNPNLSITFPVHFSHYFGGGEVMGTNENEKKGFFKICPLHRVQYSISWKRNQEVLLIRIWIVIKLN